MDENIIEKEVLPHLKKTLPGKRLGHVLGAMDLSRKLALRYSLNPFRARLAAGLHDLARCWDEKKLIAYVHRHRLKVPDKAFTCAHQPVLLHSFVGADLARKQFNVKDREILSAIEKHSLASDRMTSFEKLIFVADLLAPDRNFPEVSDLRQLAFKSLDNAFLKCLEVKMIHLLKSKQAIHPRNLLVWNHFFS